MKNYKTGFYPRLAAGGIRKNKRMYLPYILTCVGMVMMYYIIVFLSLDDTISYLSGAATVKEALGMGGWVIAIFSCIFLFYTNSFLIRRRKKEFGLYNILGMGKKNIGRIIFWETLMIALLALGAGLSAGILFSKLAQLGLMNMIRGNVNYDVSVSLPAIIATIKVFGVIFLLLLLNGLRQIRFSTAISLIRSENVGEKPPKGNWALGGLGILILAAAYGIAVSIKDPVYALAVFFLAVVMVMIGTYLVMISGSVVFCRILQKKKNYYYKANHFVSVSSMVYRMKRNGAGLASICILATMVLVMISASASLYFGEENSIKSRYPREMNMDFRMEDFSGFSEENAGLLKERVSAVLTEQGIKPENEYAYRAALVVGHLEGITVETDVTKVNALDVISGICQFYFVPLSDYNAMMGTEKTLEEGEALLYTNRVEYDGDVVSFLRGKTFRIKEKIEKFADNGEMAMIVMDSMVLIVPDVEQAIQELQSSNPQVSDSLKWIYNFDTGVEKEEQIALQRALTDTFQDPSFRESYRLSNVSVENREMNRDDFYGLFGGIFYLGIILSIVFILAAVLIIYYKQISEGYEDQSRFEIMQKVGMTRREIRESINSQLLTVFFLPLLLAVLHLAFAFPIIRKILFLFNLNNPGLFVITTGISVAVFSLFYMLVYRITSNAYYHIVAMGKE